MRVGLSRLTSTVDIVSTLLGRTETDGGLEVDQGGGVSRLLSLGNGSLDRVVVAAVSCYSTFNNATHSSPFSTWRTFHP